MSKSIISFIRKIAEPKSKQRLMVAKEESVVVPSTLVFDYENVLSSFGIKITEVCHDKIVATLKENEDELINFTSHPLCNYEQENELASMEKILINMISYDMLDEKTVLEFEKKLFSLKHFCNSKEAPFRISISNVVTAFCESNNYKEIIIKNERLHSLEFARLMSIFCSDLPKDHHAFSVMISESFNNLAEIYKDNIKYINLAWIRYLDFSSSVTSELPNALLEFVSEANYKVLFNLLKNKCNKPTKSVPNYYNEFVIVICKEIIENVNPNDIPAILLIGQISETIGMFETARGYFEKAAIELDSFNAAISLINSYEKEIRNLIQQKRNFTFEAEKECIKNKINIANAEVSKLYEFWEQKKIEQFQNDNSGEVTAELTSILTKHARYEKNRSCYDKSFCLLNKAFNLLPESYRMYSELGLLYQTSGIHYKKNRYYNPTKAIEMLEKALSLLNNEVNERDIKKVKKSILIPLANTYYTAKKYDEAMNVCNLVLNIDGHEKKAIDLLKAIRNERCVA